MRHGVIAVVAGVALLGAGGARAQAKRAPSTLLPIEPLWTIALATAPAAAPVHDAGRIFVALRDGHVTAVNLDDGEVVWDVVQPTVSQLAAGGGLLYVANRDELHGLETATGRARWSIPLEAPLSAPLVWNAGWLIAALETQTLLALRAETGETIWRQTHGRRYPRRSVPGRRPDVCLAGQRRRAGAVDHDRCCGVGAASGWHAEPDSAARRSLRRRDRQPLLSSLATRRVDQVALADRGRYRRVAGGGQDACLLLVPGQHVIRAEPQERRAAVAQTARGPAHRGAQPYGRPVGARGDEPAPPLLRPGHGGVLWPHPGAL